MFLQKLVSEVKVQVENQVHGVNFNITAICPDGARKPGAIGCGNVTSNDEVGGCVFFIAEDKLFGVPSHENSHTATNIIYY